MIEDQVIWKPGDPGCGRRKASDVYGVLFHWTGGGTTAGCISTLKTRGLSVCFTIDHDGTIRRHTATATTTTSHASTEPHLLADGFNPGYINRHFVGVEIAHRGLPPALKKFPRETYKTTIHGRVVSVLAFTDAQKAAAKELAALLSKEFGFPLAVPRDASGRIITGLVPAAQLKAHRGVLGHFHVSPKKTDCAPELLEYVTQ